jgi:hypothetical protein
MSTVTVRTTLDAPPDAVWRAVLTPAGFRFVTRGLVSLDGIDEAPATWVVGTTVTGRLRVLGVPFSRHRITVERLDHDHRALQSDEAGGLIRSWRHLITVDPVPGDPGRSRYTDVIEIGAGVLTPAVALFARGFYRLRQRRWRRLAPVLAAVRPTRRADEWLAAHETAFNTGDWDEVLDDYTDDAVLEAHLDGHRFEYAGRSAIHDALRAASAAGVQTRVARVVADEHTVAALIEDAEGEPFMVSFWHLADGHIARDVSIVLEPPTFSGDSRTEVVRKSPENA